MLLLLAGAMGACLGLSYVLESGSGRSNEGSLTGWEISMAITGGCAIALILLGRGASKDVMLRKDAIGLVGIGWVSCSLFASLPYLFCEPGLGFFSALFEAVSGLTTTGASVFNDLEKLPKVLLLWRSLTQWVGGMGILAMFVLVSASLGASGKSLFRTESSMHAHEVIGTTMRQTARWLWMLYFAITAVCCAGLWLLGMNPFQAVNYAMATVSTGGFGTENTSVAGFGNPVRIWLIIFMFLCGVSFPLYVAILKRRDWKTLRRHEETWTFAGIVVVFSCFMFGSRMLVENNLEHGFTGFVDTCFNAVSIATSTGFVVGDYDVWPWLAKGGIVFLMIVGGCAGSTAGGLKVSRLILLIRVVRTELKRVFRPNLVVNLKLNGRSVNSGARGQLLVIVTMAVVSAALGSYLLVALESDRSVDGCISAVISSLSNVGPAFGEFGPTQNFSGLADPSYGLLSALMILGRLEYIAVLVLLSRQLWRRY